MNRAVSHTVVGGPTTSTATHLDSRVSDGRSAKEVQGFHASPISFGDEEGVSDEDSLVSVFVHAKCKPGNLTGLEGFNPVFGQLADAGTQARSKTSRGHHGDINVLSFEGKISHGGKGSVEVKGSVEHFAKVMENLFYDG